MSLRIISNFSEKVHSREGTNKSVQFGYLDDFSEHWSLNIINFTL